MKFYRISCAIILLSSFSFVGCRQGPAEVVEANGKSEIRGSADTSSRLANAERPIAKFEESISKTKSEIKGKLKIKISEDKHGTNASPTVAKSVSVDPAKLIGVWKWTGNPSAGRYPIGEYKYNLMTIHPDGQFSRCSAVDPEHFGGQTRFMAGQGAWQVVDKNIEVRYQVVVEKDTTRYIPLYPGVEIIPGVATTKVERLFHTFHFEGKYLVREDGHKYRRISSNPNQDARKVVDYEAKPSKYMEEAYKEIYSSKYGY